MHSEAGAAIHRPVSRTLSRRWHYPFLVCQLGRIPGCTTPYLWWSSTSAWDLWHLARASGDTTLARPHAEPFSSSINPIAFSDVQRYVLGANIIEHVTNSNTVKNVLQVYQCEVLYGALKVTNTTEISTWHPSEPAPIVWLRQSYNVRDAIPNIASGQSSRKMASSARLASNM